MYNLTGHCGCSAKIQNDGTDIQLPLIMGDNNQTASMSGDMYRVESVSGPHSTAQRHQLILKVTGVTKRLRCPSKPNIPQYLSRLEVTEISGLSQSHFWVLGTPSLCTACGIAVLCLSPPESFVLVPSVGTRMRVHCFYIPSCHL